jgi:hypothetical protein
MGWIAAWRRLVSPSFESDEPTKRHAHRQVRTCITGDGPANDHHFTTVPNAMSWVFMLLLVEPVVLVAKSKSP